MCNLFIAVSSLTSSPPNTNDPIAHTSFNVARSRFGKLFISSVDACPFCESMIIFDLSCVLVDLLMTITPPILIILLLINLLCAHCCCCGCSNVFSLNLTPATLLLYSCAFFSEMASFALVFENIICQT